MSRIALGLALITLGPGCLQIPPEQPPAESPRKATATVDHLGRTIEGGNLVLSIPAGAIPEGERILVTVDEILGAPEGHVGDAYLVSPEGYAFLEPVQVSYLYTERMVRDVVDLSRLFVGVAVGPRWEMLAAPAHDTAALKVSGQVRHFSVFGLVDPSAPLDGGFYDARPGSDAATGQDRPGHDAAATDRASGIDGASAGSVNVQLVWAGASSDVDLHLIRAGSEAFSNTDDCYYANCKQQDRLDWPPTGPANNPFMEIDDLQGYGPEYIVVQQPFDGSYEVAVHLWALHEDTYPLTFEVKLYFDNALRASFPGQFTACDQLIRVADLSFLAGGTALAHQARSDAPVVAGHGTCP